MNRMCNFLGKGSFVEAAAIGANLSLRLMFEYFYFDRRQVEYLTPFITYGFCIAQRPTACFAFGDRMNDHVIRFIRHFESVSLMPFLTAYRFTTRLALAFYLLKGICRGRFAAIAAVFIDLIL